MPITEPRMLALISAGQDYQVALRATIAQISRERANVRAGLYDEAGAFRNIESMISELALLAQPITSVTTLALEAAHFHASAGRNRASRNWQRKRRGQAAQQAADTRDAVLYAVQNVDQQYITLSPRLSPSTDLDPDTLREISGGSDPDPWINK